MNTRKAEIYEFLMLDFLSNDFLCADPEIVISNLAASSDRSFLLLPKPALEIFTIL